MRRVALPLILILGGAVAAQIPASLPSSAPTTPSAPDTAPASVAATTAPAGPVTLPTTDRAAFAVADTMPATQASTAPTTWPSTAFAATGPSSSQPVATLYPSRNRFGGDYPPPPSTFISESTGGPDLTPKPYPMRYSAVLTRSIFIKGRQIVVDPGAPRPIVAYDSRSSGSGNTPSQYAPEGVLVFNGASAVDGQVVAFIENTGMNRITRYHVGEPVGQGAQGKISAITLDSIDYQVGARVTHVMLGQNLYGQDTQVLTTQPVATGAPIPTTGPAGTSSDGSGGGTDSVLERLRKRRMQELGQ